MDDIPRAVSDSLGPWGYILASAAMLIATAISASVGFLTQKAWGGAKWLCEQIDLLVRGHLEFMKSTIAEQTKQTGTLTKIEASNSKIEEHLANWPSDLPGKLAKLKEDIIKEVVEKTGCRWEEAEQAYEGQRKRKTP